MTTEEIKAIAKVNGAEAGTLTVYGPFVAGNGSRYWLVGGVPTQIAIYKIHEFFVCYQPQTADWGWDINYSTPQVHYAFAEAVRAAIVEDVPAQEL